MFPFLFSDQFYVSSYLVDKKASIQIYNRKNNYRYFYLKKSGDDDVLKDPNISYIQKRRMIYYHRYLKKNLIITSSFFIFLMEKRLDRCYVTHFKNPKTTLRKLKILF